MAVPIETNRILLVRALRVTAERETLQRIRARELPPTEGDDAFAKILAAAPGFSENLAAAADHHRREVGASPT
jgi:hypothetical protein